MLGSNLSAAQGFRRWADEGTHRPPFTKHASSENISDKPNAETTLQRKRLGAKSLYASHL